MEDQNAPEENEKKSLRKWLKRVGILGFLFFLVKGLMWLAVLYGGTKLLGCKG